MRLRKPSNYPLKLSPTWRNDLQFRSLATSNRVWEEEHRVRHQAGRRQTTATTDGSVWDREPLPRGERGQSRVDRHHSRWFCAGVPLAAQPGGRAPRDLPLGSGRRPAPPSAIRCRRQAVENVFVACGADQRPVRILAAATVRRSRSPPDAASQRIAELTRKSSTGRSPGGKNPAFSRRLAARGPYGRHSGHRRRRPLSRAGGNRDRLDPACRRRCDGRQLARRMRCGRTAA